MREKRRAAVHCPIRIRGDAYVVCDDCGSQWGPNTAPSECPADRLADELDNSEDLRWRERIYLVESFVYCALGFVVCAIILAAAAVSIWRML